MSGPAIPGLGPGAEFDLIRRFLERAAGDGPGVRVGPGDDCAVVGDGIAISADLSLEDVHFRRDWISPGEIGYRAAAGSLSDLAAMAARPIGVLAAIALPPGYLDAGAVDVMRGVEEAVGAVGGVLLGGDVVRSPGPLALDIVAVGRADAPVLRSGARPGHEVWVTGRLGGGAAAVLAWRRGERAPEAARAAFAHPVPRTREALWLAGQGVPRAMIDLSDGLGGDAGHLAAASGVRIVLDQVALPVHPGAAAVAREAGQAARLALSGGEDYELCFTAEPGAVEAVRDAFEAETGTPLTRVGSVGEGAGVVLRRPNGRLEAIDGAGYRHFEEERT